MSLFDDSAASNTGESPFLPGTQLQYVWDSVSLTAAMSCWRRYQYSILWGLRPKSPGKAVALDFGIAFHKAMEHYHEQRALGWEHEAAVEYVVAVLPANEHYIALPSEEDVADLKETADEDDGGVKFRNSKVRTRYHLMRAVVWYLEHYAEDPLVTLILPSGKPAVEQSFRLPVPVQVAGEDVLLSGHLDRVASHNDALYVVDYKTTKALSRQFFESFELSHQFSGYTLAGRSVFERPISGAIVDGIAVQVGGVQFKRHVTNRSPGQLNEYLETVQSTMDEAERHHDSGLYPMNTSACFFCEFKEACTKPPEYRKGYLKMLYEQHRPWNPLDVR